MNAPLFVPPIASLADTRELVDLFVAVEGKSYRDALELARFCESLGGEFFVWILGDLRLRGSGRKEARPCRK